MNARNNPTTINSAIPGARLHVSAGCTTGTGIVGARSTVCRHYDRPVKPEEKRGPLHTTTGKILWSSFHGRTFASCDAHSAACLEYGWTARYCRNSCKFVMSKAARKRGLTTTDGMYNRAAARYANFAR